jgi:menaquinone-dependent protoporphyrinogen oxidase
MEVDAMTVVEELQRTGGGAKVLVAYATKRGSTREVAEAVAATLAERGLDVDVEPATAVKSVTPYDAVVVGGALYTGRWHREAREFLAHFRYALATRAVAIFGMGPRTMDEHEVADSRGQLDKALAHAPEVRPVAITIFGGVVDPTQLHFPFSRLPASDARDWDAIETWADQIAATFEDVAKRV